jgi:acetate kinase
VISLGGVDVITFTGGIGENGSETRTRVCEYLKVLGVELNEESNKKRGKEVKISTDNSKVQVWVIPTNEELMIARDTKNIIQK